MNRDYYKGIKKRYFHALLRTVVEVGDLTGKTVLDFGCGEGGLRHFLTPGTWFGYDIDPRLTNKRGMGKFHASSA